MEDPEWQDNSISNVCPPLKTESYTNAGNCKFDIDSIKSEDDDDLRYTNSPLMNGNVRFGLASPARNEQVNFMGATADESMAVEALSQLGGMFSVNNISSDPSVLCCDTCGLHFPSTYELQSHTALCQPLVARVHVCNMCGENFERKTDLGNHIVCHQTERPHACRSCGNLFRRKADLHNHMVCHQLSRPHQCAQCGVDFQRPSSLTNHMKIHKYHPGRSMLSDALADLTRELNCDILKIPVDAKVEETLQELSAYVSEDVAIPPAVYFETIADTSSPQASDNAAVALPPYDSWNTDADESASGLEQPSSLASNSNLNFQNMSYVQPEVHQDLNHFNFFQDVTECTTVDVETTVIPAEGEPDIDSNFPLITNFKNKHSSLNFDSDQFNNASVKVEAVPYFLPEETDVGESVYSVDSAGRQRAAAPQKATSMRPHICTHCGTAFSRIKALQSHMRVHQDSVDSLPECKKCAETFLDVESLRKHEGFCIPLRSQPAKPENVRNNVTSANAVNPQGKGKHSCTNCDKKFTTKQKLFRHMWIHRKKHFICEICNVSAENQDSLDDHRRAAHPGETPFVCQSCGKSFASRQGLWEHGRVHGGTNTSLYWCNECNKSFSSRQGYLIHTRTHTGERPYGCRFCMKAFRDGGTLRKHERIHTGERPHVCPICYRAFNQKVVLREHVRWVHAANRAGEETEKEHVYSCQICNLLLGDREELCAHIVKHSDDLAKAAKIKPEAASVRTAVNSAGSAKKVSVRVSVKKGSKKLKVKTRVPKVDQRKAVLDPSIAVKSLLHSRNGELVPSKAYMLQLGVAAAVKKQEHSCGMCEESFGNRLQLLNHVRIHI